MNKDIFHETESKSVKKHPSLNKQANVIYWNMGCFQGHLFQAK